jgi:alkanesulfonate monooxygenase SsuD/methylene tetrahydromethanopterin reductase-like flavin-dependent oxidoreductase (luciferase family)
MDFGIITEASMVGGSPTFAARYHEVLEEAKKADEVGFSVFGVSEQHFNAPLCSIPSNEIFLSALAVLTKNIKLRTAITLMPFHHPVRVAEQIATIDILSGGRVEFGSGKGNSLLTSGGFNVDVSELDGRWTEGMDIVVRAWSQDEFSYDGKFYKVPPRRLSPTFPRKPHPDLWYAAISPRSHELAGSKGMGVMSLTVGVTLQQLEKRLKAYTESVKRAEPYAGVLNKKFSVFCLGHCADTNEEAIADAKAPMLGYLKGVVDMYEATVKAGGQNLDFTETRRITSDFDLLNSTDNVIVGDPQVLVRKIKRYEEMGVDEILLRMEGLSHEKLMRAIELIGKHVIPEFKKH